MHFLGDVVFSGTSSRGRQTDAGSQRLRLISKAPQEFFHRIKCPFVLRSPVKPLPEVRCAKVGSLCQRAGNSELNPKHLPQRAAPGRWLSSDLTGCWTK